MAATRPRSAEPARAEPAERAGRAKRLPAAERRAALLETAAQLLDAGGADALRMDALARAAGVSRPVVYEHFGDRDGLVAALIREHGTRLHGQVADAVAGADTFEDELRAAVRAYLAGVREQGAALRGLLRSSGAAPEVEEVRAAIWEAATTRWARRYRDEVDIGAADAEALASFHLHGLWSLADRWLAGTLSARRVEQIHLAIVTGSLHEVARSVPRARRRVSERRPRGG